ncbi:MAG TPA: XRE family transcription factor [Candidatus Angelobacter sp.]|nr:XRE family transcription factor [Candidatus Angelobacter sp.]
MKKRSRSRVDPATFDWSKHDATTDRHVRRQIADDPDTAPELTPAQAKRARAVHPPASIDVQRIRRRLGLSQAAFASRYGFRTRTVQEWEQRRRRPEGPARILLRVIEREPEAIERALKGL